MIFGTRFLALAALMACLLQAAPAFSDTVTVTESADGTVVKKTTVTETMPVPATIRTTVTETPGGTVVKKTATEAVPDAAVRTTVTTVPAATVSTETVWPAPGARVIAFTTFDIDRDSIISLNEIGRTLFKIYDTDDNNVIDNIEYQRRVAVAVTPIEKNTVVTYDFDGDGIADKTKRTYETIMQETMLIRFDRNRDGLSPYEFTGLSFLETDVNDDKAIDLKEWQGTYIASIDRQNRDRARFN